MREAASVIERIVRGVGLVGRLATVVAGEAPLVMPSLVLLGVA